MSLRVGCSTFRWELWGSSCTIRFGVLFAICMDLDAGSTKTPRPWLSGAHGLKFGRGRFGPTEATEIERLYVLSRVPVSEKN